MRCFDGMLDLSLSPNVLSEKAIQVHGGTPSFYDIQLMPENGWEKTDGGRPKSAALKVVSEPMLLRSSIGSATAAAIKVNGQAGDRPSSSPAPVHRSVLCGEVNSKETRKNALSKEEVSVVKTMELLSYTIPSFSAITVSLRQVEVCRQRVTLDAFCTESPSLSLVSLTSPKRLGVNESCFVPVSFARVPADRMRIASISAHVPAFLNCKQRVFVV